MPVVTLMKRYDSSCISCIQSSVQSVSSIQFPCNSRTKVVNALPLPKNPPHGTPSAFAEDLFEVWLVGSGIVEKKLTAFMLPR